MRSYLIRVAKRIARRIIGRPILGKSILVYHRVAEANFDPWNLAVTPEEFEHQLAGLRKKTVLPLSEFVSLHAQNSLPRNAVAITFDDGYACNALVAAPMLESFGYSATFFVVSDAIARPEEFWWDQLEFIFHARGFDYETATRLLANYAINGPRVARRDEPPLAAFLGLWGGLHHLSTKERRRYLDELRSGMGLKKGDALDASPHDCSGIDSAGRQTVVRNRRSYCHPSEFINPDTGRTRAGDRLWLALPRSDTREADTLLFVSIWPEGARDSADRQGCGIRLRGHQRASESKAERQSV